MVGGPEITAGELIQFFYDTKGEATWGVALDAHAATARQPSDRSVSCEKDIIINDFNRGSQHLLFMVTVKFSSYTELPYRLFAIAHYDETVAQEAARYCLAQWDRKRRLDAEQRLQGIRPEQAQSKSRQLFEEGSALRPFVILFAEGVPRDDPRLEPLLPVLASFLFIPVVERGVDGASCHHQAHQLCCSLLLRRTNQLDHAHASSQEILTGKPNLLEELCICGCLSGSLLLDQELGDASAPERPQRSCRGLCRAPPSSHEDTLSHGHENPVPSICGFAQVFR